MKGYVTGKLLPPRFGDATSRAAGTRRNTSAARKVVHARKAIVLGVGTSTIVVVADTHGRPHPKLATRIEELAPAHIFHAGDVGDLAVLRDLERFAPLTAVRGNIDGHDLPDLQTIDVRDDGGTRLKVLLTHIAVNGTRLRADVVRIARAEDASLVVCGHSHVPFAAQEGTVAVFNPGSVGPRRFQLPIVFGVITIDATAAAVRHVDCETGLPWRP